jgi:hypothetical protein
MTEQDKFDYIKDTLELNARMEALTIAAKSYKEKWKSHFEDKDLDPEEILGEETVKECQRVEDLFDRMMNDD